MRISVFDNIKKQEKANAIDMLITHSTPRQDFFLLVILSVLMATTGLLQNSVAVIIGSMLIAPVLYPILGIAMGIVMADAKLIFRSLGTLSKSFIVGIAAAIIVTIFTATPGAAVPFEVTPEIMLRAQPSLADAFIAIVAGMAASFALVKPQLSETLPGVVISVALVPPLATFGIGLALQDIVIASNAFILFNINILGILFAAVIVFSIMNFYVHRTEAKEVLKKEDRKLEKEENGEAPAQKESKPKSTTKSKKKSTAKSTSKKKKKQ